ncbi:MAG TPA: FeoB-associated Cys-rich membrane protein [Ruminiclostridium sp.]
MIDYIIIGVVAVLLYFAIRRIIKNKKKGSCCGCSGCESKDKCSGK